MKKKIIITLSKRFPQTHSRKGEPTYFKEKLGNAINDTPETLVHIGEGTIPVRARKIHTIRTNFARWQHNLDKLASGGFCLSVRQWSGKPYNSPQDEIFQLHDKHIGCQRIAMSYDPETDKVKAVIDGKHVANVQQVAQNDGLSFDDFKEWFFGKKPTEKQLFNGVIIHFTPFRYGSDANKSAEDNI